MPSNVEKVEEINGDEIEVTEETKNARKKEAEIAQKVNHMPRPPPLFPQKLEKKTEEGNYRRFITMLKQLSINVPLIEASEQMSGYAKFMKDLVTKKRAVSFENDEKLQHCSAISTKSLLGIGAPKPIAMRLLMADRTVKKPIGVLQDVLVKVGPFISRLRLFPRKLKSKWTRPFLLTKVLPNGAVELKNSEGTRFMVNGQRIKIYLGNVESVQEVVEAYYLDKL
ncbi:uncharacterized protein LOC125830020 [Solanum verrucosum]|uniref:uncharacterized protein LOC125830020 n=1 Tax=Solanum verrucosum TaxID=315347 RepID=UPI0020D12FDC|nr:uncharacterized protein LOC125830020 [Solanum verrucosum]